MGSSLCHLDLLTAHEPKSPGARTALSASSEMPAVDRADKAVRAPSGRFMESLHFLDTHWDREPSESPLNRPPGTFSPTGGEGWDEGVRFMERVRDGACVQLHSRSLKLVHGDHA
jgi:hypothetical protein